MMREHFGPGGDAVRLLAPRARFNTGDGIRMALALGADLPASWNGMHTEPVDPRDPKNRRRSCWSIPTASWSIAPAAASSTRARASCTRPGRRSRARHAFRGGGPHGVRDPRRRMLRDPGLSARHPLRGAAGTRRDDRRAGEADRRRRGRRCRDGRRLQRRAAPATRERSTPRAATASRPPKPQPPKSNWARAIGEPPFLACPLVGAVAYTFGGLATDDRARVLRGGAPIPGLYAAGEITGHFHARRRTRSRCCARSCSAASRGKNPFLPCDALNRKREPKARPGSPARRRISSEWWRRRSFPSLDRLSA